MPNLPWNYFDIAGRVILWLLIIHRAWTIAGWRGGIIGLAFIALPADLQVLALTLGMLYAPEKVALGGKIDTGERGPSRPTPSAPTGGVRLGPRSLSD
jgi:hypothetical protein